jgi:hypothetical protein
MNEQSESDGCQDKFAEFGDVTLISAYRKLKRKKEHNQREQARLKDKEQELDEQLSMAREEINRRDELNIRHQEGDEEQ